MDTETPESRFPADAPLSAGIHRLIANEAQEGIEKTARARFAHRLFAELALHLPYTLERHFEPYIFFPTATMPPEQARYNLWLQAKTDLAGDEAEVAFGSILKTAAALIKIGYEVEPLPKITAHDYLDRLNICVNGKRGGTRIEIVFREMPETSRCKLVYEEVEVPAHTERRRRVDCEGAPPTLSPPKLGAGPEATERVRGVETRVREPT